MKVLVTGRGTSGSWQIRGVQLGNAIGAHVEAEVNSVKGFDVAIVVKRVRPDLLQRLKQRGVPLVWDVVDAWPQPEGNHWHRDQCKSWLRDEIRRIDPFAIVAATQQMLVDCDAITGGRIPCVCLPHHARPGLEINHIRMRITQIGYEGGDYLGKWLPKLEEWCLARDVNFVVNPKAITDLDVVIAVRDQAGYAIRNWKSNVKLANAQGSGTPCVMSREKGYLETAAGAERWADTFDEMTIAISSLWDHDERVKVSQHLMRGALLIENIASRYTRWLSVLSF